MPALMHSLPTQGSLTALVQIVLHLAPLQTASSTLLEFAVSSPQSGLPVVFDDIVHAAPDSV